MNEINSINELNLLNEYLTKKEAFQQGFGKYTSHRINELAKEWKKRRALFPVITMKAPIYLEIQNEQGTKLSIKTFVKPKGYLFHLCSEKESNTSYGNTILGGKLLGIMLEKHSVGLAYNKNNVEVFQYKDYTNFDAKQIIKDIEAFTKTIKPNTAIIQKLLKDMQINSTKYEKQIAYG